jgi:hypothetical protein
LLQLAPIEENKVNIKRGTQDIQGLCLASNTSEKKFAETKTLFLTDFINF